MNPGHRIPRAFALALALLGVAGAGQAQPGALDLGFANGNGYFGAWFDYLPGGSSDEVATAVVRHDDGRLTVVGHFAHADGSNRDCGLLRTDADAASYDVSFLPPSGFGAIAIDNGGDDDDVCMAALDRGAMTVLVAGGSGLLAPGERSGTLLLLSADGSLDPSFFDDGVFQTVGDLGLYESGLSVTFERLRAMPDGGVLVAGQLSRNGAGERVVLLRLDFQGLHDFVLRDRRKVFTFALSCPAVHGKPSGIHENPALGFEAMFPDFRDAGSLQIFRGRKEHRQKTAYHQVIDLGFSLIQRLGRLQGRDDGEVV